MKRPGKAGPFLRAARRLSRPPAPQAPRLRRNPRPRCHVSSPALPRRRKPVPVPVRLQHLHRAFFLGPPGDLVVHAGAFADVGHFSHHDHGRRIGQKAAVDPALFFLVVAHPDPRAFPAEHFQRIKTPGLPGHLVVRPRAAAHVGPLGADAAHLGVAVRSAGSKGLDGQDKSQQEKYSFHNSLTGQ